MALASIWVTTAALLADMGLGAAIIQFRDLERREIDTCFWITVSLAVIGYAVLALCAPGYRPLV
jgi:Polysaccharide biosynthesis protein